MAGETNTDPNPPNNPNGGGNQPEGGSGEGGQPQAPPVTEGTPKQFTQEQVNTLLANQKRDLQTKSEQAESARKGEFEKLYNTEKSAKEQVEAERDATKAELEKYKQAVATSNKAQFDKLPEKIKKLAPPNAETDPLVMSAWLPSAIELAGENVTNPPPGNPVDPKPKGVTTTEETVNDRKAKMRGRVSL